MEINNFSVTKRLSEIGTIETVPSQMDLIRLPSRVSFSMTPKGSESVGKCVPLPPKAPDGPKVLGSRLLSSNYIDW